jgi:hypothetical protein
VVHYHNYDVPHFLSTVFICYSLIFLPNFAASAVFILLAVLWSCLARLVHAHRAVRLWRESQYRKQDSSSNPMARGLMRGENHRNHDMFVWLSHSAIENLLLSGSKQDISTATKLRHQPNLKVSLCQDSLLNYNAF